MEKRAMFEKEKSLREKKHEEIAYRAALEGIVLLKNEDILPISPRKIALFGAGAKHTIKGGSGSGEVNERHSISIMEGLISKGFEICTKDWIEDYDKEFGEAYKAYQRRQKELLKKRNIQQLMEHPFKYPYGRAIQKRDVENMGTDYCIYVISRQSGEGSDRRLQADDFSLSDMERENLTMCARFYPNLIIIMNVGGSFDLRFSEKIPEIKAVIHFAQQGSQGGKALADLITGEKTFSGKLTDTWYRRYKDVPSYDEYSYMRGNPMNAFYEEAIFVGYRYCDSYKVEPKYPFGYGKSYTDFQWEVINMTLRKTKLHLKCRVKNCGKDYSGKEILQFYISCPQVHIIKEYQRLVAFYKTRELKPGAEEEFEITIDTKDFASYHEQDASFMLDEGDYILRIGNSSRNTNASAIINLDRQTFISIHQNVCKVRSEVREITPPLIKYPDEEEKLPRLQLRHDDFHTETFDYQNPRETKDKEIEEIIEILSDYELVQLVVGAGMKSVLLNQNEKNVPGAVGSTTSKLTKKGVPNAIFADGPAGLRLSKRSTIKQNGKIKMVDAPMEFLELLPNILKKWIFGNPDKHPVAYQYATAFPIATALAQSWNTDLVEEVGTAIGKEMEEFGVEFWLGPAMNIHRNPLCGRNFEYYSEDPYLTGKMAAAAIRGCQKVPGNKATIKHFCVNNQEDNRQRVSSNINERVLREIYLRGFEIAVKESRPKAVMTSYNRINGAYTANSYDLCTKVLRNEWGFEGVVMTDWYATGEEFADSALCIKAGNDLIMPGKKSDKKRIFKALRKRTLDRKDLERSGRRILTQLLEENKEE